jgi:hypothetical protein
LEETFEGGASGTWNLISAERKECIGFGQNLPPLVQKIKSSRDPSGPGGKNQKKSYDETFNYNHYTWQRYERTLRVSPVLLLIGSSPDHDGPMSKLTSGIVVPST